MVLLPFLCMSRAAVMCVVHCPVFVYVTIGDDCLVVVCREEAWEAALGAIQGVPSRITILSLANRSKAVKPTWARVPDDTVNTHAHAIELVRG